MVFSTKNNLKKSLFMLNFCLRKLSRFSRYAAHGWGGAKRILYILHKNCLGISDRFALSRTAPIFLYFSRRDKVRNCGADSSDLPCKQYTSHVCMLMIGSMASTSERKLLDLRAWMGSDCASTSHCQQRGLDHGNGAIGIDVVHFVSHEREISPWQLKQRARLPQV